MNKLFSGAIGVEIALPASGNKFYFPDIINLRNKRIKHIEFCSYTTGTHQAPSGNVIPNIDNQLSLTLMEANTQQQLIQNLPVENLQQNGNRLFINKIIDFQRSFITHSGTADTANKSLYFVFMYDEPAVWNMINTNNRTIIEPLEIQLTGYKTYFKEQLNLLNKKIENILLSFPVYSPQGNAGIASDCVGNKFLTLSHNNFEFFKQVPLYMFYQVYVNQPLRIQDVIIDYERSYIETLSITADDLKTVFFNMIIDDNK